MSGKTIYVSGYRERRDDKDGIFVDFFITHIDAERAEMNGAKLPMDFTAASRDLRIQTSHGVNLVPLSDGVIAAVYHCEFVTDQERGGVFWGKRGEILGPEKSLSMPRSVCDTVLALCRG